MIKYYRTMDHQIHEISEPMEGTWISLIHPTAAELAKIATDYKIDIDDLRAPLDEEERSHIEVEEGYTLFIVDVPTTEERKEKEYFLYQPFDNQESIERWGTQAVTAQTGFGAALALELIGRGIWKEAGVYAPEYFDPTPYLELMKESGYKYGIIEK